MKIKLGKVFKGIGKALGGIAKSLFKGKLFNILGKVLKFIPGLNLGGILGSALKVLGSARKVQNFLQVGRQVFEALRGKHRIDDRVQNLPAPSYPPPNRLGPTIRRPGDILQTLPARVDPEWIRRILDGFRRLPHPGPHLGPYLPFPPEMPALASAPGVQTGPPPDSIQRTLEDLQRSLQRILDDLRPRLSPYLPFPPEQPGPPILASAPDVLAPVQGMLTELSRWLGGGHPVPGEAQPPVIIR
ncbi:hypothetical protein HRbin11_00911 [bacterium HR11]|nr:hypothetical protein HRbin11_00911 [bacterium HR11]